MIFLLTFVACLLVLLTLLLSLRLYFVADCGEELYFYVKILFLKFTIHPQEPKKVRMSDYSYKRFMRKKRREMKKSARLLSKQTKKTAKQKEAPPPKKKSAAELIELIKLLLSLFKISLPRFFKHLRIDIAKMKIIVGGPDPASTAITYGIVSQLASYVLEYIDNITNLKKDSKTEISVLPDFLSDRITYDIHFKFSLRVWHMLDIGIRLAYNYLKGKHEFSIPEQTKSN